MYDKTLDFHIHPFVRRQVKGSGYSYWDWSDKTLDMMARVNWKYRKQGYRDGVVLVPVPAELFYTTIVTLQDGDALTGTYKPRTPGEDPRKSVTVRREGNVGQEAKSVIFVLYRDDVLAEDGDQTGHEWNLISVNAFPTDEEAPMEPDTLIANHFHLSGGTKTGMTDTEFVKALQESVMYWKDKARIG